MFSYEHTHPSRPDLNCRIEVGVDTVRIGFFGWQQSWVHRTRLEQKGWEYKRKLKFWGKHHKLNGMQWRHWPEWIDAEVALPRIVRPNNSSMIYDPWAALTTIRKQLDSDIELKRGDWVFRSPDWEDWCVSRADVTADFTFKQVSEVNRLIDALRTAKMTRRPKSWFLPTDKPTSFKWASEKNQIACSIYDKFKESGRPIDRGKVRMTVIFNERRNKPHLRKHGMRRVTGLFDGDEGKFLDILVAEIKRIRPKHAVNTMRYLLEQAAEDYHHGAAQK
jgi:hypothetical protein